MPTNRLVLKNPTLKPLALLSALAVTNLLGFTTASADNLLANPGFEVWETRLPSTQTTFDKANVEEGSALSPENWAISQAIRPGDSQSRERATFTQDADVKHEGNFSLKITIPEGGGEIIVGNRSKSTWHPMPFAIDQGKSYKLQGWVRTENIQASTEKNGSASIRLADNEKSFFAQETQRRSKRVKLPDLFGATEWTPFELRFDAQADDNWCYITIEFPEEIQGTVWIDDLSLTEEN